MKNARAIALSLMVILGFFIGLVLGALLTDYRNELQAGVTTSPKIVTLKTQLAETPDNTELLDAIRSEDLSLRRAYFANRRLFQWGAWSIILALAVWVAAATWFFSLAPPRLPSILNPDLPQPGREERERQKRVAIGISSALMGVVLVVLAYVALFERPFLPKEGWTVEGNTSANTTQAGAVAETPTVISVSPEAMANQWPCFRGPGNIGVATQKGDYPTTWTVATEDNPTTRNIAWKTFIPMPGNSSPVIWDDKIFLSGGTEEAQDMMCFDRKTGTLLWDTAVDFKANLTEDFEVYAETGYAACTPVTDGTRVYGLYATGVLAAFDYEGKQVWARQLSPQEPESMYNIASSLMYYETVLIVQYDEGSDPEEERSHLFGINPATGEEVWATKRPTAAAWSSPALIPVGNEVELITTGQPWIIAYEPLTGKEKWRFNGLDGSEVAPSPAYGGGLVFVANDGANLYAFKSEGATGDITATTVTEHLVWIGEDGMPDTSSPVANENYLLQSAAGGYLTFWDIKTGKMLWEDYLDGGMSASPIIVGDLIYLARDEGTMDIMKIDATKFVRAGSGMIEEATFATPAFVDSKIYIRGVDNLYCVGTE